MQPSASGCSSTPELRCSSDRGDVGKPSVGVCTSMQIKVAYIADQLPLCKQGFCMDRDLDASPSVCSLPQMAAVALQS